MFRQLGYIVRSASDGFSALSEMRNEVPDILLSDLNMPGMSGFELLSVVRRRFPAMPVIAMSGSYSGNDLPLGVAADGFFQKGSGIERLLRIIAAAPKIKRLSPPPSSAEAPIWIAQNGYDSSGDPYVTIACPGVHANFPPCARGPNESHQRDELRLLRRLDPLCDRLGTMRLIPRNHSSTEDGKEVSRAPYRRIEPGASRAD